MNAHTVLHFLQLPKKCQTQEPKFENLVWRAHTHPVTNVTCSKFSLTLSVEAQSGTHGSRSYVENHITSECSTKKKDTRHGQETIHPKTNLNAT